ncbi:MAG: hypothetical protein AAB512_01155 [Patescibacteria group bacterium]
MNLYLDSGKILMLQNNRLEDLSTGEDQGYPFILSVIGKTLGMQEMTFGAFIKFNYLLLITLGVATSVLLFLCFNSLLISLFFYYSYLRIGFYNGGIDHHWMLGAYIPFYVAFLMFFLKKRGTFKPVWFTFYFLVAGIANIVREGYGVIAILLLVSVVIVITIQDGIKKYKQSFSARKQSFSSNKQKPIFRLYFSNLQKNILIISLLILVYLAPMFLLNGVRSWRNFKYFDGQSSDMITHHGIWHNAFMGLGYIPNSYGIQWDDNNPIKFVHQVNPNVGYMTNEYYSILRGLYFKYSFESPNLWFGNILAKTRAIDKLTGEFIVNSPGKFLPPMLRNYFFYISLFGIFILSRKDKIATAIFWLILVAILISSIPGFIGAPSFLYLGGLLSAFFITWFYFVSLIYLALKDFLKTHWSNQPLFNFL